MLLQEDIDLIKREGMKKELYAEILKNLDLAKKRIEYGVTNSEFEKQIVAAEEILKTVKQLYLEWVKVNEQYTRNL